MLPVLLGPQTFGSSNRPASFCGGVVCKLSHGLIDTTGMKTLAATFDTIAVFSRTVDCAVLFASVLARRSLDGPLTRPAATPTVKWSRNGSFKSLLNR